MPQVPARAKVLGLRILTAACLLVAGGIGGWLIQSHRARPTVTATQTKQATLPPGHTQTATGEVQTHAAEPVSRFHAQRLKALQALYDQGLITKGVYEQKEQEILSVKTMPAGHGRFPAPFAKQMKRGVNIGNTLDAPVEGEWGAKLRDDYFDILKAKGIFDTIRIPCRWETHSGEAPPYAIDPAFMQRVDWAVSSALSLGFHVVLNMHHHTAFEDAPLQQEEKFLALWKQISAYFKDYPANLVFEIYNEPGSHLADKSATLEMTELWNRLWPAAYNVIRQTNPERTIAISGPRWANPDGLSSLIFPAEIENDPNTLVEFHFYYPTAFCFQNTQRDKSAEGIRWRATMAETEIIRSKFAAICAWARNHHLKLWNGEFTCHPVPSFPEDRLKWINFVTRQCEENGIPWCYWDFAGNGSRVYNPDSDTWNEDVLNALTAFHLPAEN